MPKTNIRFGTNAKAVNLVAPDKIVRGRLPAIDAVQDRLARQLRVDLFQYLRYGVQVEHAETQFEPHDELLSGMGSPVLIGIVSLAPLRGFSLISVDGALVGATVDRLCGASETLDGDKHSDFSVFEARIAQRLLAVIQRSLKYAWQGVADLTVDLVRTEVNTAFIAIADAQEQLITMRLKVTMATGGGEITIAVPYPALEPIRDKLTTAGALTEIREEDKRYWHIQMQEALTRVPVRIRAELTRAEVPSGWISDLEVGQVLPIQIPDSARVYCGKTPLFDADFGARNGALAIRARHFNLHPSHTGRKGVFHESTQSNAGPADTAEADSKTEA